MTDTSGPRQTILTNNVRFHLGVHHFDRKSSAVCCGIISSDMAEPARALALRRWVIS